MKTSRLLQLAAVAALAGAVSLPAAQAATQSVLFDHLTASSTVATPLAGGDNLLVDALVTSETGALNQVVNFTLGAGVSGLTGNAAWNVSTATGTGPRLVGVNIDIFNSANTLVASDTFAGVLANFAHSTFAGGIGPGSYRLVATGTGVRDSSLDIALSFTSPVPEPEVSALMLAGLGVVGYTAVRRRRR